MPRIVKVSKTEFVLDNGTVCPIPFDLEVEPTVEEFQKTYDYWLHVFREQGLTEDHEQQEDGKHRQGCRHAGSAC